MRQLEGRPWKHGSTDCFGLVREYFALEHDIRIKNYARPEKWWDHGLDLYRDFAAREGFEEIQVRVRDVLASDVFLMAIRSRVPNHAAVYIGDNQILHHPPNRLSVVEEYAGLWHTCTVGVLRHRTLNQKPKALEMVDLLSLPARSFGA